MKIVNKNESAQVLTDSGRLVVAYPTEVEARAFLTGYKSATRDIADRVSLRTSELIREIGGTT
jgi:hypothetical protein